ncbi:MAG TPA: ABC transporter ATP-binding protein [Acholeplasmataceae bacterium]|nr:ABC transporter ATP-binding protein [Acholeplasmataceae bacterium]
MSRRRVEKFNYSTKEIFVRVFKYAMKSKYLLLISLFALIIYSAFDIIQPLIIKRVIDDELAGVQTTWVEVSESDSNTAIFNGKYYSKQNTDEPIDGEEFTIRFFEDNYYLITGRVGEKDTIIEVDEEIVFETTDSSTYTREYVKLSKDDLFEFYRPSINPIILMIIYYAIVSIIIIIARYIQNVTFRASSMRLTLEMRKSAFDKINRLPISYFSKEPKGKIVTKMIHDSEGVEGLYQVVFSIISAVISLVMIYGGLFYLDTKLALLTLLAFPIIYLWMRIYRRVVNRYNHIIREMNSRINGKLAEFVNTVSIIQIFNKEKKMTEEYNDLLFDNYKTKMRHLKINTNYGFNLLNLIRRLVIAGIIVYFSLRYFSPTAVVVGTTIYVYIEYLEKIMGPINEIFSNLNALEDSLVSSSRIFEFLDEDEDTGLGEVTGVRFNGDISFKDIHFKYEKDNYVLKGINFDVKAGDFVGIVGATGSGKSTLISLLERFYDIEEGAILIDGVNYHEYSKQDVRNNIGIILQDPSIFEGTIKSNVTFGIDATDEEVIDILLKIGADKFVKDYPLGIHSRVAYMGENLSTGEKQLIAFARILLRNPSIVILDEATANIDTETEMLIQNALTVLSEKRTTFVIAHRLSTIKNADIIYVMDDGKIVESGTHQELYNNENGKYRAMYDALN